MSRFAFISDIHANLGALDAVLGAIAGLDVTSIICLGDVVGYGPHPGECLDIVRDRCDLSIQGNHDLAIVDDAELDRFNPAARIALEFSRDRLSDAHLEQIRQMPVIADLDEATVSHASPVDGPTDYVHDQNIAALAYGGFENRCLFIGHTHIPLAFGAPHVPYAPVEPADVRVAFLPPALPLRLDTAYRYILNPGSVGQPRDGNPDASFGILDVPNRSFAVHRVAYDIQATQQAILHAGLPNFLAQRLRLGA